MQALAGFFSGVIFGIGLALSGMAQPGKVLAFLDVTGNWDPSLALVMGGAIAVFAPLFRFIVREKEPVYMRQFVVAAGGRIDAPLLFGSVIFGVGWGLGGYCPGPGLVSAGSGAVTGQVFAAAMVAGMLAFSGYERLRASL
jgi:hypothetical protein